jgi:hypothetical protein
LNEWSWALAAWKLALFVFLMVRRDEMRHEGLNR